MPIEPLKPTWRTPQKLGRRTSPSESTSTQNPPDKKVGTYWVGADGNVWTAGPEGVTNRGKLLSGNANGFSSTSFSSASYARQEDPNPPKPVNNINNGTAPPKKVLDQAGLNSLDALIASLNTEKDQAIQRARLKRNDSRTTKDREREREKGKYEGNKLSTLQDFAGAKTDTDLNTRNTLENLMSSLSTLGLGGSRALTRQLLDAANMSNRKANATQAKDNMNLDSAFNEYDSGYQDDIKKIEDQLGYETGEANRGYYKGRQNALYKKADIYNDFEDTATRGQVMKEADDLNGLMASSTFLNPSYTGASRAMATPELGDYTQNIAKYDTTNIAGADSSPLTPVASDGMNAPAGNLAVRAIAVNDKDLGIKKKSENDLGYGV